MSNVPLPVVEISQPELPTFKYLIFEDLGHVARITLNRPTVTNALSIALSADLCRAVEYLRG